MDEPAVVFLELPSQGIVESWNGRLFMKAQAEENDLPISVAEFESELHDF